jgi:hypothetical protein
VNGEEFDPAWSPTGYLQKKHAMKAEALNELSRSSEALAPLNAVRKRARESYLHDEALAGFGAVPLGLLPDVLSTDQQTVRQAIRHERRVELGFEFHRYFDLMRYGQSVAEAALTGTGFTYTQFRYFPIPQSELDTNPLINN